MNIFRKHPFIVTFIFFMSVATITLTIYLQAVYDKLKIQNHSATKHNADLQVKLITNHLQRVEKDIKYFSKLYNVYTQKHTEDDFHNDIHELQNAITSFSEFNPIYAQIRFLDTSGKEFLRVDNMDGKVITIEEKDLQDKSKRYYFQDSLSLKIGEIYLSPFDLNVERGEIEIPYNPTIRVSTPIYKDNRITGYVIINYSGQILLDEMMEKNNNQFKTLFVNKDGYYMVSDKSQKNWGFMFNKEITLAKDNKNLWDQLLLSNSGSFEDAKNYYSFFHINPVNIVSPNRSTQSRRDWSIITYVDKEYIFQEFKKYLKSISLIILAFSLIIIIFSVIIWMYVHKLNLSELEAENAAKKLIEADKLAALGQLIAGIAHEINSPLGAIKTSSTNTFETLHDLLDNIHKIDKILDKEELELFKKMQSSIPKELTRLSIKEQRGLKKTIKQQLQDNGIANDRYLADILINFEIQDIFEYKKLLLHPENKRIFKTLYDEYITTTNLLNIQRSVDRVSRTVFALKKFAHFDYDRIGRVIDIQHGVESTLTLLHHNLKQGIELETEFEELESIFCYEDELVQVWMNLIMNAMQAMNNSGKMKIKIYKEGIYHIVSISDTGPGIPKELHQKIFEPFFTTKVAGEGSGLGLDIVKKIIDAHKGIIAFDTSENGTTFYVKIPSNLQQKREKK